MNKLGESWETGFRRHKVLRITRMITFGTDDDLQNDDDDGNARSHMSILLALLYPVVVMMVMMQMMTMMAMMTIMMMMIMMIPHEHPLGPAVSGSGRLCPQT